MGRTADADMLAPGLRALGVLAHHAPVAIDDLARLSGTTRHQAMTLVEAFVKYGYAARFADTASYVLTDLAWPLVPMRQCEPGKRNVH